MLDILTRNQLRDTAATMAMNLEMVRWQDRIYVPVDYETLEVGTVPPPDRRIWIAPNESEMIDLVNALQGAAIDSAGQVNSFLMLLQQHATKVDGVPTALMIRTSAGLRVLDGNGEMHLPDGSFLPFCLEPLLNESDEDQQKVLDIITEWLGGDEEAVTSLLHHLATALAPHWPAVKYVLLIGDGRNGKSLLMEMLENLVGSSHVSGVTRQNMADSRPTCASVNGKLVNIVYDGEAQYLKETGLEKTLTAGERAEIQRLYVSHHVKVQTNALFIEGLNREPRSRDKSSALQKRIVRFHFPNVYMLDHEFHDRMLSEPVLGAFLGLLLKHYVRREEAAEKLAPTKMSEMLKLEQMRINNVALKFLEWMAEDDMLGVESLIGLDLDDVTERFQLWRQASNEQVWDDTHALELMRPLFVCERKSKRVKRAGEKDRVIKVWSVTAFKPEVLEFLAHVQGEEAPDDGEDSNTVVAEPAVHQEPAPATD